MMRPQVALFGTTLLVASCADSDAVDSFGQDGGGTRGLSDTDDGTGGGDTADDTTAGLGEGDGDSASVTVSGDGTSGGHDDTSPATADGNDGSDDGGPPDPGPVPSTYPGVDVGLCTPPGIVQYCYTGAPATYLEGVCGPGTQQCLAIDLDLGEWSACQDETLPSLEICNGLDDDCDGQTDEDQGFDSCGLGRCAHQVPNCVGGAPVGCDPFEGATPEVCDGIDNDCDGDIDEGLGDTQVTCGVGVCEHSVTACEDSEIPACDPFAGAMPEVCDGIDNDCDGLTDEGIPAQQCGCGACDHMVAGCINGVVPPCDPFQGAGPEACDGVDNDCDCITDEDQGTWTCGANECEVTVPQCIAGVPQANNTCQPLPGGAEICGPDDTSLAYDFNGLRGFATFVPTALAGAVAGNDWGFFPIIGKTGTAVLTGTDDIFEFNDCSAGGTNPACTCVEAGQEYVKLAKHTGSLASMFSICELDWDAHLSQLASDILAGVPNDTYVLSGNPVGTCGLIDPSSIVVVVNGIPLAVADWTYDPFTCEVHVIANMPTVGDNVVVVYDNF